jgi:hypothetical protein
MFTELHTGSDPEDTSLPLSNQLYRRLLRMDQDGALGLAGDSFLYSDYDDYTDDSASESSRKYWDQTDFIVSPPTATFDQDAYREFTADLAANLQQVVPANSYLGHMAPAAYATSEDMVPRLIRFADMASNIIPHPIIHIRVYPEYNIARVVAQNEFNKYVRKKRTIDENGIAGWLPPELEDVIGQRYLQERLNKLSYVVSAEVIDYVRAELAKSKVKLNPERLTKWVLKAFFF